MGVEPFLVQFVDHWAYLHSDLYPVPQGLITDEFKEASIMLSHQLAVLMITGEEHDPLALLFSEFCKGTSSQYAFFPTTSDVSKLVCSLMMSDINVDGEMDTIYEPCVGTGGLTFQKIIAVTERRSHWKNPLGSLKVIVEDVHPTAVKSFFIQVIFLLKFLSNRFSKNVYPDSIRISSVNVLTGEAKKINFQMDSPKLS
ncbi:hypothetical protein BCT01_01095 [Vibrio tasmaniensis]|nr:hypothetical protein BCT01_01095 [Vibrio tasmaniensis]PMP17776.1 hypothetical protein BCS92_05050 [Vibrio tasmaniensis]